jgi:methionyl-tRNA formyltransferase
MTLRIIYMGTPEFAVPSLKLLVSNGWNVVAVVTAPDKPQGRGRKLMGSPVKQAAEELGIPVLQPSNLKSPEFVEELRSYKADVQVVVAFRMLPEVVWNMPPLGTFNLHASLLPDYRGAAPINWAIINGETVTGVTTFFLQHEIDTGNIIFQEEEPILPEDNVGSLYEKLMNRGSKLVLRTIQAIAENVVEMRPQDESKARYPAPKLYKEMGAINWDQSAVAIHNLVRGLSPYPAAWTNINGKTCKIYTTEVIEKEMSNLQPGEYYTDGKKALHYQTGDHTLAILELQIEGKKRMEIEEFLRGNKL